MATTTLPDATLGAVYGPQILSTGGVFPYYCSIGGIGIGGFYFDRNCSLNANPSTLAGTYQLTAYLADSSVPQQTLSYTFTINIKPGIELDPLLNNGAVSQPYADKVYILLGGTGPYTFAVASGQLPSGLQLSSSSGAITGTATIPGTYIFTILVTDSIGLTGSQIYSVQITGLTLTSDPSTMYLPTARAGIPYAPITFTIGGGVAPYTVTPPSSGLPAGLTMDSQGVLSGTPATGGTYSFEFSVRDQTGDRTVFSYCMNVLDIAPIPVVDGYVGTVYGTEFFGPGFGSDWNLTLTSGALPPGISFVALTGRPNQANAFYLQGTPTQAGAYTFTMEAVDSTGLPVDRSFTLYISRPYLSITKTHAGKLHARPERCHLHGSRFQRGIQYANHGYGCSHGGSSRGNDTYFDGRQRLELRLRWSYVYTDGRPERWPQLSFNHSNGQRRFRRPIAASESGVGLGWWLGERSHHCRRDQYSYSIAPGRLVWSGGRYPAGIIRYVPVESGPGRLGILVRRGHVSRTGNIFARQLATSVTSQTVSGIPTSGGMIFVRLWTQINGSWQYHDYSYTALNLASVVGPVPDSTLGGSTVTFTWTSVTGASAYWLDVGTLRGQGNIFAGQFAPSVTSQSVSGIPIYGGMIFVRLWTQVNGSWQYQDYSYTALNLAAIVGAAPGATLSGSTVTFTWTVAMGASAYWLDVGTVQGQGNIFAGQLAPYVTSQTVNNIPTAGQPVYVQLWTLINSTWNLNRYTYTSATTGGSTCPSAIVTPASGSTFAGSSTAFNWAPCATAQAYWLDVGIVLGQGNIFASQLASSVTIQTVNNIPTTGQTIYVQLWTQINGTWNLSRYTYTASTGSAPAVMSSPVPGSTFSGSSVTFVWTVSSGASAYWLDVGTVQGQGNIFATQLAPSVTSQTVSGIPTNGGTIYVRLWTQISGTWSYHDYVYTAY